MSLTSVVYVGPTVDRRTVKRWLPGAQVMPPIRRGDLYRDRRLGYEAFLVIDGLFLERMAISPREIIDVIRDGAVVWGASSMGAIRAADCWPAGMRGVGSIYRLFRRGSLLSDDEVAMAFSARPPYRAATVPLINIRFASRHAVRKGLITPQDADRLITAATNFHYADREWRVMLSAAGIDAADGLLTLLNLHDLKRLDAIRALKAVRGQIKGPPSCEFAGLSSAEWLDPPSREASAFSAGLERGVESRQLWRWLLASGLYRRYGAALRNVRETEPKGQRRSGRTETGELDAEAAACMGEDRSWGDHLGFTSAAVEAALARERSPGQFVAKLRLHRSGFASRVWADMAAVGDIEAVLLRFMAVREAAALADEFSASLDVADWQLARAEIAANHGLRTWRDLRTAFAADAEAWSAIEEACQRLAMAKRVRRALFPSASDTGIRAPLRRRVWNGD